MKEVKENPTEYSNNDHSAETPDLFANLESILEKEADLAVQADIQASARTQKLHEEILQKQDVQDSEEEPEKVAPDDLYDEIQIEQSLGNFLETFSASVTKTEPKDRQEESLFANERKNTEEPDASAQNLIKEPGNFPEEPGRVYDNLEEESDHPDNEWDDNAEEEDPDDPDDEWDDNAEEEAPDHPDNEWGDDAEEEDLDDSDDEWDDDVEEEDPDDSDNKWDDTEDEGKETAGRIAGTFHKRKSARPGAAAIVLSKIKDFKAEQEEKAEEKKKLRPNDEQVMPQDAEEHANIHRMQDYKNRLSEYRRKKWFRYALIALIIIVAAVGVFHVIKHWKYTRMTESAMDDSTSTRSFDYYNLDGNVLRVGVDGATLSDTSNAMIWSVSYRMEQPTAVVCEDTAAIYDKSGTDICICDKEGEIGSFSTNLPIVKAKVAEQGVVAAILDDSTETWISYYDSSGNMISTLKTTSGTTGYPMDLALSHDGMLMSVSYLYYDASTPCTRVYFYNFGSVGQNRMDNQVSSFDYPDCIAPETIYFDKTHCALVRDDGLSFFEGSQLPALSQQTVTDEEILSVFYDDSHIGIVTNGTGSGNRYHLLVYNKKGKEILDTTLNVAFQKVQIQGSDITFSTRTGMYVISLSGVEKYSADFENVAQELVALGHNRYVYTTEDTFRIIQLK